ncbi:hypothetical protein KBD49_12005 [Myxococcota bacterium]|nr:hypothetical protein [Myxococcota bacterium]
MAARPFLRTLSRALHSRTAGWTRWDFMAWGLLAASLAFRLVFFDQARFAADEALQYHIAREVGDFRLFPTQGTLTTVAENARIPGGAYFLIIGLPQFLFHSPEASMALIVLVSVAGLGLGYRLFRREYGPPAALAAMLLAAFNPFHLFHSDRIWNPNLMAFFGFLALTLLVRAVRGEGRRPLFWLAFLLVAVPQIHLSCVLLAALAAVLLAVARPRDLPWRQGLWGAAAGFGTYVPYFVADGLKGFPNTRLLLGHAATATAPVAEAFRAMYYMVLYPAGEMSYFVAKGSASPMTEWGFYGGEGLRQMGAFLRWGSPWGWALTGVLILALLLSLAAALATLGHVLRDLVRRGREAVRQDPLAFLALVNLPLVAMMFWGRKLFFPHYTMVVFPLALVPAAWAVSRISQEGWHRGILALLVPIAATQGFLSARYYQEEEAKISVPVYRETARRILEDSPGVPVALECALPRTQCSGYPVHVLAIHEMGRDFREDRNARRRYTLTLPGEERARGAIRVWDLGPVWLVRRDRDASRP